MVVTYFHDYKLDKRKKVRVDLNKVIEIRKQQIALFEKTFIKPLKSDIENTKSFLKGNLSKEEYLDKSEKLNNYIQKWMEIIKK